MFAVDERLEIIENMRTLEKQLVRFFENSIL
jgi:hypothetical protein